MTKYICDFCGEEMKKDDYHMFSISLENPHRDDIFKDTYLSQTQDICPECAKLVKTFFTGKTQEIKEAMEVNTHD